MSGRGALSETVVVREPDEVARYSNAFRGAGRRIALVPTMGALHAGHLQLVQQARRSAEVVVVSIFVNPLQFGPGEDLAAYPRTLERDVELLRAEGVDVVFAPSPAAMYPQGRRTMVYPGPIGDDLEGRSRPGHFAGMLTVVLKLFTIVSPHVAFFGEKDYQQLTLIRQMVHDLNVDVRVAGVPTVREHDGLALSSRNAYLTAGERRSAVVLSAALTAGSHAGPRGKQAIVDAAREVLSTHPEIVVDYVALRNVHLGPAPDEGEGRLLVAAKVGSTRLIDNVGVVIGSPAMRPV